MAHNLPTVEEALEEIGRKPLVNLWPTVGVALGISRGTVYAAAERGEIEVMPVGRLKKAVSAPLRRKLGIEARRAPLDPDRLME
jgi:hypothetical protein